MKTKDIKIPFDSPPDVVLKYYRENVLRKTTMNVLRCSGKIETIPLAEWEIKERARVWWYNHTGKHIKHIKKLENKDGAGI